MHYRYYSTKLQVFQEYLAPRRVLVLIQVGVASLRRAKHTPRKTEKSKNENPKPSDAVLYVPPRTRFSRELRARSSAVANVHWKFALYRFPFEPSQTQKGKAKTKPQGLDFGFSWWSKLNESRTYKSLAPSSIFICFAMLCTTGTQTVLPHCL